MAAKDFHLYFLALIPNHDIVKELSELKEYFAKAYDSKASLNSVPHITLHMPFKWRDKKLGQLHSSLKKIANSTKPFQVKLVNFGCFEPKTIYVDVEGSDELNFLQELVHKEFKVNLKLMNANYKNHTFHPHITLAFRGLTKFNFKLAWEEFKEKKYNSQFEAKNLCLLKHNGIKWEIEEEFPLKMD